jgi:Domain of unknown function (DUF4926)
VDLEELDVVALTTDVPEEGLEAGTIGTVVHIFHKPNTAYEVEFVDGDGATIAMATLTADQIRPHRP